MTGPPPPVGGPDPSLRHRLARLSPEQRRLLHERVAPRPTPLTPTQFGIWLFEQLHPGTTAYHNPAALRLRGALDTAVVWRALDLIQRRHDALRVRVGEDEDGLPVQTVTPHAAVSASTTDLRGVPADDRETQALAAAVAAAREPFDLSAGPVWRARLIRLADDDHVLVVTFHHIVSDGWSLTLVLGEFAAAYEALVRGREPDLPPPTGRYAEVMGARVDADERGRLLAYWRRTLAGAPTSIRLPTDTAASAPGYAGGSVPFHLDEDCTAGLRTACRSVGASVFAGVTAAFCAALHQLTGQRDLVLITPVAGRDDPATQVLVGCLLNTVPLRVHVRPGQTLLELVADTGRAIRAAVEHAGVPFAEIAAAVGAAHGEASVSNVMVLHGNASVGDLQMDGLHLARYRIPLIASKHDWALLVTPGARDVAGELEYRSQLFTPATVRRGLEAFHALARLLATEPEHRLP